MKTSLMSFENGLKFCRRNELCIKKPILLSIFEQKILKKFGKEREKLRETLLSVGVGMVFLAYRTV